MTNSMKSENKLDGASNFRAWKTRIDLILAKNKVLDIVKGKIVKPEFEEGEEKEPQNVAAMEKFKDVDIKGEITKVGYTFVTIGSPNFRKTIFRPN
jgi:hypothetical protein